MNNPGHITKGDLGLRLHLHPRLALAEAHRLGAAGLHLTEEHEPQTDQDEQRQPANQVGQQPAVSRFLDLDLNLDLSF